MREYVKDCPRCAADWMIDCGGQLPPYQDEGAMLDYQAGLDAAAKILHNHPVAT